MSSGRKKSPTTPDRAPQAWSEDDFAPVAAFLQARPALAPDPSRAGLLLARLRTRLQASGFPNFRTWFERVLKADPGGPGLQLLVDLNTVNHTTFFREPAHFEYLVDQLGPRLRSPAPGVTRVWSAGCSTGQEPYSMAMALAECVPVLTADRLEVWATDLSSEAIDAATAAIYAARDFGGVTPERARRFFLRGKGPRSGTYRVVPEVRTLVRFRPIDLRYGPWPLPADFQAIFCRNVSIYFPEDERTNLLERLATQLAPGGWLAIGTGEIIPGTPACLRKVAPSIYRKEAGTA